MANSSNKKQKIEEKIRTSLINADKMLKEDVDTAKSAFDLLDESRQDLQNAQAKIYTQTPAVYQQLYQEKLTSIYNHVGSAITELNQLVKQMHSDLKM